MVFGRPGSGKSTFSILLAAKTDLPLYHLDKYFFTTNWVERDKDDFIGILGLITGNNSWIIDGNSIASLEMRWKCADLVIYFNCSRVKCLFRLVKRRLFPRHQVDDRADACPEILRLKLIKYMWNFDKRVDKSIHELRNKYPQAQFIEVRSDAEINALLQKLRCLT
jgi:adenylate kinase family enzyme